MGNCVSLKKTDEDQTPYEISKEVSASDNNSTNSGDDISTESVNTPNDNIILNDPDPAPVLDPDTLIEDPSKSVLVITDDGIARWLRGNKWADAYWRSFLPAKVCTAETVYLTILCLSAAFNIIYRQQIFYK